MPDSPSPTVFPNRWGTTGQGRSPIDSLVNGYARRGLNMTPSIITGTWGRMITGSSNLQGAYFDLRISTDSGATWGSWTTTYWNQYTGVPTNASPSATYYQYRWRLPLPDSGYFRIEWDELNSQGGSYGTVTSLILDDCYRGINTFSAYGGSESLTGSEKVYSVSGSQTLLKQSYGGTLTATISATPITLTGVAVSSAGAINSTSSGYQTIGFTPSNGAQARSVHKKLYKDSSPLSGDCRAIGAILDSPGSSVTSKQTLTVAGQANSASLIPRYAGGKITAISPTSGTTGIFFKDVAYVYPDTFTGSTTSGTLIRAILTGTGGNTITYTNRSFSITNADLPSGYHPFKPDTWPTSPTYTLSPTGIDGPLRCITLPRFFVSP